MNTPYTTRSGLQIGCKAAAPPRHEYHDQDALRLQAALLGHTRRVDWDGIAIVIGLAVIVLAAWVTQ